MRTHAALDPPAETKRQFLTLVVWVAFLLLAVVVGASHGTRLPGDPGAIDVYDGATRSELHRSRLARLKIAVGIGLLAPAAFSYLLSRRYRRHGAHARGITVELTADDLR